jgi:hypothetical protein
MYCTRMFHCKMGCHLISSECVSLHLALCLRRNTLLIWYIYEVLSYWKVPRLGQKRNAGLTYSILAAVFFKIVSLGMYTVISFFPRFKSTMEVIFLNAVKYRL